MTFINHYRQCGHHPIYPGMHMLRIANLCFSSQPSGPIPIFIFFLSVLICFLVTTFFRQKGNSLYLHWNMLSPFISAFYSFYVFMLQLIGIIIHFLPFCRKKPKIYQIYVWVLKHNFKIHQYPAQIMGTILKRWLSSGAFLKQCLPTCRKKILIN